MEGLESAEPEEEQNQAELERKFSENDISRESETGQVKSESGQVKSETGQSNDTRTEANNDSKLLDNKENKENCDITNSKDSSESKTQGVDRMYQCPKSCQGESESRQNESESRHSMQVDESRQCETKKESESRNMQSDCSRKEESMEVDGNLHNGTCDKEGVKAEIKTEVKYEGLQNGIYVDDTVPVKKEKEEVVNGTLHSDLNCTDSLFRKVDQFFERDMLKKDLKKEELVNGIHDDKDLKVGLALDKQDTKYTDLIISLSKQVPVDSPKEKKCESPASFRSVESMIDKTSTPTSSGAGFVPSNFLSPISSVTAEQMLRTLSSRSQGTWFSLVPRLPCDEGSLTRVNHKFDPSSSPYWNTGSPASFLMNDSQMSMSCLSSRASTPFNSTLRSEFSRCDTPTAIMDETLFQQKIEQKQYRHPRPILKGKIVALLYSYLLNT